MKAKHKHAKSESLWNWYDSKPTKKRNGQKPLFPVSEFLHKAEESLLGPGFGAGVGCGVGLGFGVVGGFGFGFGGSHWNQLKLVLGVGFGCGLGLGLGYGQGFGYGYSLESLGSYLSEPISDSKMRGRTVI